MRTTLSLLLIILFSSSCAQRNPDQTKPVADSQDKGISDEEIRAFMEAEMKNFENLNTKRDIKITKIDDVKKTLPGWFKNGSIDLRFRDIDAYNVDEKLVQPFFNGKVSSAEFIKVLEGLNPASKKMIPIYFTSQYHRKLKEDRSVLDKVLALDKSLGGGEGFLIRCTQQVEGFQKAIADSIQSNTFQTKYYSSRAKYLSRYAEGSDHAATLALLTLAVNKMPAGESLNSSEQHYLNPFEFLMVNGDEAIRRKTRLLIFDYLDKASLNAINDLEPLFAGEISNEFKSLLKKKRDTVARLKDPAEKKEQEEKFQSYYLVHEARNFGMTSLPQIKDMALIHDDASTALPALRELISYHKLTEQEKQSVVELLKQIDKQKPGVYLPHYATILKQLYPKKKASDFSTMFKDEYAQWTNDWNRRRFSADSVDYYLTYFSEIGFDTKAMTPKRRYLFRKEAHDTDSYWLIFRLLDHMGVAIHYDCETGMWPNPYDDLLNDYTNLSATDLKDYSGLFQYEKLNEDFATKYTVLITNGTTGYLANPEDGGDWYDPVTVESVLNHALKDNGVGKRFLQLPTGDQTVFVAYCSPGQYKLIASKFGLPSLGSQQEEY